MPGHVTQYTCTVGESSPRAELSWTVKDEDGEDVPYTNIDTADDDKVATISLQANDTTDKIDITCIADNGLGQAINTIEVRIASKQIISLHVENVKTKFTSSHHLFNTCEYLYA